tara:strand:+ start:786 stop:1763 length:978 start_codon:yes stop_codon:yes gene_type:complete
MKNVYFYLISFVLAFKQPIPFAEHNLPKNKIHKIQTPENQDVAVWWNKKTKEWNAVHNVCPHRQASLSEGVVNPKSSCIKCRYHGMEFNKQGKCTMIPSSTFNPSMFSVKNYFVKEKYGLLWIDDKKNTDIVINILEKPHTKLPWFISVTEADYKSVIENSIDAAHFNQVHHGIVGLNRYKSPLGIYNKSYKNWFNSTGFSCTIETAKPNIPSTEYIFLEPYNTQVKTKNTYIFAITYPINNGKIKFISNLIIQDKKWYLDLFFRIFRPLIKITGKEVFRQDIQIINSQNQNLYNRALKYTTISQADIAVTLYNKWLEKYGNENI